ncbi:pali-domain-containing protein [Mycena sanguinolenta]|nr:pali-domain-containing protein [Mycena sanguinolenta]
MFALHIGTFLIFSAMVLLIVASISAPTVAKIDFLSIPLSNGSSVNFGSWGFCILSSDGNSCTPTGVGYKIANEISALGINSFSGAKATSLHGLTEGFILHPIAAGIAGIAFLLAVCSHRLGYLFASAVAFIAFLVSLVVMIIDFIVFGAVKDHVDHNGGTAKWGNAIWMVLAATIVLFFASIATCFACVTARRRRRTSKTAAATY